MRTVGISHKTRYWQHYCFSNPPEGYGYRRMMDIPWHMAGIRWEFLANTKLFFPLVHADLYHTYNGLVANAKPWVIEVESYMPRFEGMDPGNPLYRWGLRRLASDDCKTLIFTSHSAFLKNRDHLVAAGVDEGKMTVVYRAVEQYAPLERDQGRFTILFAGNGFYRKGGVELLKAFKRLDRPEARLVIISTLEVDWGIFPDAEVIAWAERTVADDPRITLYRKLPHPELITQMRKADIFVSTTFADPFNNTILEAMGTQLPIICSNFGSLKEVVQDGRNGWLLNATGRPSAEIAEDIAAHLKLIMDEPAIGHSMGLESMAIVREKFALGVRNAALTEIYDNALR